MHKPVTWSFIIITCALHNCMFFTCVQLAVQEVCLHPHHRTRPMTNALGYRGIMATASLGGQEFFRSLIINRMGPALCMHPVFVQEAGVQCMAVVVY